MTIPQAMFYLTAKLSEQDKSVFKRFKKVGSMAEAIELAHSTKDRT